MKNKFASALSLALIMAMLFTSVGFADTVTADYDLVTTGIQAPQDLGNVAPGATLTVQVGFSLVCSGNNHVDNAQSVSIALTNGSTVPAEGSLLGATSTTIGATRNVSMIWDNCFENLV